MTTKQYILLAHIPKKGTELEGAPDSTEWHIYGEGDIPRMMAKKAYYETIYSAVYIRECSEIIYDGELAKLSAGLTRARVG